MLAGVATGVVKPEAGKLGVGGEVAEGIVYDSKTSISVRVKDAIIGWRLEVALIVLNLNFLSSGRDGDYSGCEELDIVDTRRL